MPIKMLALYVVLSGSLATASCSVSASGEQSVASTASWPSCNWPAALDPDESGSARAHCVAARTRLSCALPGGETASCTTNDPTGCEGGTPPGAECHAECAQNEFSAQCGGVGPGPVPAPPAGCRSAGIIPAGIAFYCCPCGG